MIFLAKEPKPISAAHYRAVAASLDAMRFDIDTAAVHYYGSLFIANAPKKEVDTFLKTCASETSLKRIPKLIKWGSVWRDGTVSLPIPAIHFMASIFQIPAELLIVEEKYFNRMGIAGYRLAFEAYRKGYTLDQLAEDKYNDLSQPSGRAYRSAWRTIISGYVNSYGWGNYLHRILQVCRKELGIDVGILFSKPVRDINKDTTTLSFTDMLVSFNTKDMAMLMGMAKLIHDYKLHRRKTTFREGCNELIRWYQDGSKKE